jgi:prepilin-type processing-associated H-X9-DG protein
MLSERLVGLYNWNAPVYPGNRLALRFLFASTAKVNQDTQNAQEALQFVKTCQSLPGTQSADIYSTQRLGFLWDAAAVNANEANTGYFHFNTPNKLSCTAANTQYPWVGDWHEAITATSNHPGGVNVCFGDGSVKFIKDSISIPTWWAIGSRNQGETISSDGY